MSRVLILGGRAPAALELARRFHRAGHAVLVADSAACRLSGASRSVQRTVRLPSPRTDLPGFAARLAATVTGSRIDLVVPTCEEVFYLAHVQDRLPTGCAVFAPPFALLRQLHSKHAALQGAASLGVRVPEGERVHTLAQARDWARGRAVVLKPEFSRFGVDVRRYPDGIPAEAPELPLRGDGAWVVQRLCAGEEICSYAVVTRGRVNLSLCYAPTWRIARSSSYYFEPRHLPRVDAAVRRLAEGWQMHGQLSFDWFVEPDGTPTLIECNPRAVSGVHLLPRAAPVAEAMLGGVDGAIDARALPPRMIAAVMLAAGLPQALREGQLPRWRRDWARADDVLAEPDDRAPLGGAWRDLASVAGVALRRGLSLREASTRDIEWDGEALPPCR